MTIQPSIQPTIQQPSNQPTTNRATQTTPKARHPNPMSHESRIATQAEHWLHAYDTFTDARATGAPFDDALAVAKQTYGQPWHPPHTPEPPPDQPLTWEGED